MEDMISAAPGKKPTKKQLLHAFKDDMRSADSLRLENVKNVETWRKEYNGEAYGNEQKGKSAIVSRDIKRQDEWQHPSVKDPFVADTDMIKCKPVTEEDVKAAQQNEVVLNYQFTKKFNRYRFMTDVVKLYYAEGTVIVKTSWRYKDKIEEVEVPIYGVDELSLTPIEIGMRKVKKLRVLENRPHAECCRIEDLYVDPTCEGDLSKAQFIIHRYESDLSTLRQAGKYKNLDRVARNMAGAESESASHADFDAEDETEFRFKDQPRKKILVHEYWGNFDMTGDGIATPIVCSWVGDDIIQLEDNPYPDQEIPFLVAAANSTPFKLFGEAAAEVLSDNQKINTAIKRGIIDNMANANNAQKGVRNGTLDPLNKKRFLNGSNFEYNGSKDDFYEGSYNNIPPSVFHVLEMTNNENDSMVGVKAFSGGIQGAQLGSTAKAASGVLDAVAIRRGDIVRNLAQNLIIPLARKWMSYNSKFLRPEEVIRVTNKEFVNIRRDDLQGEIDIEVEVSTSEENAAKAQELAFMLQTLGQSMDQGMRNIIMSQIARLKKMPDLAAQIENYQPQPDPLQVRMAELEIEKMEAEIRERNSRAEENVFDIKAKNAQAELNKAKARELGSKTDLLDQDFIKKTEGRDLQEDLIREEHKANLAQEQKPTVQ